MVRMFQHIFMKWFLCFLIGLLCGLIGFFNNLAVENIAGMKFVITSDMMLQRRYGFVSCYSDIYYLSNFAHSYH